MRELVNFYRTWLKWLVGLIIAWLIFVPTILAPFINKTIPPSYASSLVWGANMLSSKGFVVGMFVAGEFLIRKMVWKFWHPELDMEGVWKGVSTYTEKQPGGKLQPPEQSAHILRFEQDCLKFTMKPTTGKSFVNWGYHAINLVADEEAVKYAYWVNYSNPSFPPSAIGYEELKVIEYEKGRPVKLSGWFRHCINGEQPAYSGIVEFQRVSTPRFFGNLFSRNSGRAEAAKNPTTTQEAK
ncbi:MAG TPA: hypothetical protein VF717_12800 [Pyrinomonadaceae bacterium]|jgi:hypothetical protein